MAVMYSFDMSVGTLRRVTVHISTVHVFTTFMVTHGSADNPSLNGTLSCSLCHQDLDLALSQRAQAKVDKFREGYAAPGLRHAFLPALVSTSGRIHDLLSAHYWAGSLCSCSLWFPINTRSLSLSPLIDVQQRVPFQRIRHISL